MKAIFFDLDGTLIDSIGLIVRCFQHTVQKHVGRSISKEEVLSQIGRPLRPVLESLSPGNGEALINTYREVQFGFHDEMVKPFDGMLTLLEELSSLPIHVGIVTSKARPGTNKALELFGSLASVFQTIITVEDCRNHKPDPEPLLKAASLAGCAPSESIYIGDTHFDMEAAVAASMTPVGVTWGVADAKRLEAYTNHVFQEVSSLSKFLRNSHIK